MVAKEGETNLTLRLPSDGPDSLYERLKRAAAGERRSKNAQILLYIEVGLDRRDRGEQP